jgi:chemotaxis-related protein WspB
VVPLVEWRSLPGVPGTVRGVFNYHGRLVPVLDMSLLAFNQAAGLKRDTRIAVVEYHTRDGGTRPLGLLLENATRLIRRDDSDFTDAPVQSDVAFAGRVTMHEGSMIQQIELRDLISDDVWDALDGANAEAAP